MILKLDIIVPRFASMACSMPRVELLHLLAGG